MGLFDSIAGAVLSNIGGEKGALLQSAMEVVNEHGGLSGVLEKFNENGFAAEVKSWVGTGGNLPITAEQIQSVLGDGTIANLAEKAGISSEELSEKLAVYIPQVVDRLTPNGEVPQDESSLFTQALSLLKS